MTGGDGRLIGSDDEVGDCIGERKVSVWTDELVWSSLT